MNAPIKSLHRPGIWLLAGSSAAGLLVSCFNYFSLGSGIDHTFGAILVVVSTALSLIASLGLATARLPRLLRKIVFGMLLLDLIGTSTAAYFLESWAVVISMGIGFTGWLIILSMSRNAAGPPVAN